MAGVAAAVAVMVVDPGPRGVAAPLASMRATAGLADVQVTRSRASMCVPSPRDPVTANCCGVGRSVPMPARG